MADNINKLLANNKERNLFLDKTIQAKEQMDSLSKLDKANEENSNSNNIDINLPLHLSAEIGQTKFDTFRKFDKATDEAVFRALIDGGNQKEQNALKAQQAQEKLDVNYDHTYDTDILAPIFSTKKEPHLARVQNAIKTDKKYLHATNTLIPLELKQSNELVDLQTQQAINKAHALNSFYKKQVDDDIALLKEDYKLYANALQNDFPGLNAINDNLLKEKYQKAYNLVTNNYSEMTQTSTILDNFIRSGIHLVDSWASLSATLSASLREGSLTFKEAPILEKLLENMFDYKSYNKYQEFGTASAIQETFSKTMKMLPIAHGLATMAESSAEILNIMAIGGSTLKGFNKTVLDARHSLLAEKVLTKNMSKHLDRQIALASVKGNDTLKSRLELLKQHILNPTGVKLAKDEFMEIAGAVASTFNKYSFFQGVKNNGIVPLALLAGEFARRGVDLYKDKPDGYKIGVKDAFPILIHMMVDFAFVASAVGVKNAFVGAKTSFLNKRELAKLEGKQSTGNLTKEEVDRLNLLKQSNKTRLREGFLLDGIISPMATEGFGEMIQTHIEQQVQSGYTLPSFADMLLNDFNIKSLAEKQDEMYKTGILGAIGGVAFGAPIHTVSNVLSATSEKLSERANNLKIDVDNGLTTKLDSSDNVDTTQYQDFTDKLIDKINQNTGNDLSTEGGKEADKRLRQETKALRDTIEEVEQELDEEDKTQVVALNNQSRIGELDSKIEQLEQQNDELKTKQQQSPTQEQQKSIDENNERITKLKKARDAYERLDNHTKSLHIAANISDAISKTDIKDKTERDKINQAIKDLQENQINLNSNKTSQEQYEEAVEALNEVVKPYYDKDTLSSILKLSDSNNPQIRSISDSIDKSNNTDNSKNSRGSNKQNLAYTGNNQQQPSPIQNQTPTTQPQQGNSNQQQVNQGQSNQQGNQTNSTSQDTLDNTQPNTTDNTKNIEDLTLEDIQSLSEEKDKEAITNYLSQVSPEVALIAFAHSRAVRSGESTSSELQSLLDNYSIVKLDYSKIEADEGHDIQSGKREHEFLDYQDSAFILVPKNFFNPLNQQREKINDSLDANNTISTAINGLSKNAFEKINRIITRITNTIENGKLDDATIDTLLNDLDSAIKELYQNVFSSQMLLNGIIGANRKSPIVSYIRNISNRMAKDLEAMKGEYLALADMLKNIDNNDAYNKALARLDKESKNNAKVITDDRISDIIEETTQSVSTAFSSLRQAINKYREQVNDKNIKLSSVKHFKQKLINSLKAFVKITKKIVDIFARPDIARMHDMTVALLQLEPNQLLGLEQSNNTINIQGIAIPISQLVIFQNILFNPLFERLNYKFNGHDATKIVDSLLSTIFSTETFDANISSLSDLISPFFKDIKISLSAQHFQPSSRTAISNANVETTFNEVSLQDLITMDYETARKLNKYFGMKLKDVHSEDEKNKYAEKVKKELHSRLNNKSDSLGKNIRKRLSIAMAGQEEMVNQIDNLVRIGLVANAFAISQAGNERFDYNKNESTFSIEKNDVLPQVISFVGKLFGDVIPANADSNTIVENLAELSYSLANTYLQNTSIGKVPLIKFSGSKILINADFKHYITNTFKRDLSEWGKTLAQKEFESNDVNDVLEIFNTRFAKRIPLGKRRALMINLQNTGRLLNETSIEILKEIGINFNYDELVSIFKKENTYGVIKTADSYQDIKIAYLNMTKEERKAVNEALVKYIEALENDTFIDEETKELALQHPNMYMRMYKHRIDTQEVQDAQNKNNKVRNEVKTEELVYVAITNKNGASILNRKLFNNLKLNNLTSDFKDYKIFNIDTKEQLAVVVDTIEGRLASYGDAMFKLANMYENNPKNKIAEKDRVFNYYSMRKYDAKSNTYKYSKIDFSKAVYSSLYMMPNGRTGRKTANTEIDNKIIREISQYIIPDEIVVNFDKDGNAIKEVNKAKQQWAGVKNITAQELLDVSNLMSNSINERQIEIQKLYYGVLFSMFRAFNGDFTSVELNQLTKNKIDRIVTLNKEIKDLQKELQNTNLSQRQRTQKQNTLNTKLAEKQQLMSNLEFGAKELDYKIKYQDSGKDKIVLAKKLLNGLIEGKKEAIEEFEKIAEYFRKNPDGIFDEHPGMSRNNRIEFLKAIKQMKRGSSFINSIQTQNLLVYMDGKATFSAENSARMRSINTIDAFAGVIKTTGNYGRDITLAQGFVQNQILLAEFQRQVDKFANNNSYFDSFLEILDEKGIDIYTTGIGTTTNVFRALNNTNNLFTSILSFGIINRNFSKSILQPKAYGASNESFLDSIIENSKFMNVFFLQKVFEEFISNPIIKSKILEVTKATIDEEYKKQLQTELSNAFQRLLSDINNGSTTNIKLTQDEEALLKGYINYFNQTQDNALNFLFNPYLNIFQHKENALVNYDNLYDRLYINEEDKGDIKGKKGIFISEKNKIETYFNNFDITKEVLSNKAMLMANAIAELIKNTSYRRLLFDLKNDWYQGLLTSTSNAHLSFELDKNGNYKIKYMSDEIKAHIAEVGLDYSKNKDNIDTILINTFLFYRETQSLLFNHKPMFMRANVSLSIVEQNNSYLKEHKKYLDDKLFNGLKDGLIHIIEKVMGNEVMPKDDVALQEEYLKRFQERYRTNSAFRQRFNAEKSKFLIELKNGLLNSAWSKQNRDLFINFIKDNPSLEHKQRLMEQIKNSIEEHFKDLDNNLTHLLLNKQVVSFANSSVVTQTFLSRTSIISNDVIGLWNHNFEAMLIIEMNNPHYQIFDAIGVNANQAVDAMNTWSNGLGLLKGGLVDSASIISNIDFYLDRVLDKVTNNKKDIGKQSSYNQAKYSFEKQVNESKYNEAQIKENIKDRLKFLRNLIRHFLQVSEFFNIGSFNISSILMSDNKLIQKGQTGILLGAFKKAIYEYMMYIEYAEKNNLTDIIELEKKDVAYTRFNTKDINVYNSITTHFASITAESLAKAEEQDKQNQTKFINTKFLDLVAQNRHNFTRQARSLLKSTYQFSLNNFTSTSLSLSQILRDRLNFIQEQKFINSTFFVLNPTRQKHINISRLFSSKLINLANQTINNELQNIITLLLGNNTDFSLSNINTNESLDTIVEKVLNYEIQKVIKSEIESKNLNLDKATIDTFVSNMTFKNVLNNSTKINNKAHYNTTIAGETISVNINDIVEHEQQLYVDLLNNTEIQNSLQNEISKIQAEIEQNNILGFESILLYMPNGEYLNNFFTQLQDASTIKSLKFDDDIYANNFNTKLKNLNLFNNIIPTYNPYNRSLNQATNNIFSAVYTMPLQSPTNINQQQNTTNQNKGISTNDQALLDKLNFAIKDFLARNFKEKDFTKERVIKLFNNPRFEVSITKEKYNDIVNNNKEALVILDIADSVDFNIYTNDFEVNGATLSINKSFVDDYINKQAYFQVPSENVDTAIDYSNAEEKSAKQYAKDVNNDFNTMKEQNPDIAEEIDFLQSTINNLMNQLLKLTRFFYSKLTSKSLGMVIPKYGNTGLDVVIFDNKNLSTRIHELWHAITTYGFDALSNDAKYYVSRIQWLHGKVKEFLEANPNMINELGLVTNELGNRYDYIFNNSQQRGLEEFSAAFLSEPKLIRFLSKNQEFREFLKKETPKVEGKTMLGKLGNGLKQLTSYTYSLIMKKLTNEPESGFYILASAMAGLSIHNNFFENKVNNEKSQEQKDYESKAIVKANRAISNAFKFTTAKADRLIEARKLIDPTFDAEKYKKEIREDLRKSAYSLDLKINTLVDKFDKAQTKREKIITTLEIGITLLQLTYFKNVSLSNLFTDKIKKDIVNDILADMRQKLIENTIFDIKILLDFGITGTQYMSQFVNQINRALGRKTSLNYHKEIAMTNIKKEIQYLLAKPDAVAKFVEKNPQFLKQYSEGIAKLVIHNNLGDYFFGREINQNELDKLADYIMSYDEGTNLEIESKISALLDEAFTRLNLNEEIAIKNTISKIIRGMGYTRITDKRDAFGTQNIEQVLRDLEINIPNEARKEIYGLFHQASTLEAILAPRRLPNDKSIQYYNSKLAPTRKFLELLTDKNYYEVKESLKEIITLHKKKTDNLYTRKTLRYKDEYVQDYIRGNKLEEFYYDNKMETMYEESTAFDYGTPDAFYDHSKKWYPYNQKITIVRLNPNKMPAEEYNRELRNLVEKGFKQNKDFISDDGTVIFVYSGWIDYNSHRQQGAFLHRAMSHQGSVIQYLSDEDIELGIKEAINEEERKIRKKNMLEYGKNWTRNSTLDLDEFYSKKNTRAFAGSETMTREQITNQMYEELAEVDTSLESSFSEMEKIIFENQIRHLNNDNLYNMIIESDKYIRNSRTLDNKTRAHHTVSLFEIISDSTGKYRVKFNKSLLNEYGINLSRQDESDFHKMLIATGYLEQAMLNGGILADTRLLSMMFGFELPSISQLTEKDGALKKLYKAIETTTRYLVKETRNNTIIRNPYLVFENFKSNLLGLAGEGVPISEIAKTLPYYIEELNTYMKLEKEQLRLENEITLKSKQQYRDTKFISAEAQQEELNKLKNDLAIVKNSLKDNSLYPLIQNGMYSNIVEDAETQDFKWDKKLIDLMQEKYSMSPNVRNYVEEFFITEDSDTYKGLAYLTRLGDFIPRAILYHHLIGKEGLSQKEALDISRDRFINYNTPLWSPTMRMLDRFGFVNYTKYAFAVEKQIYEVFKKMPLNVPAMVGVQLGMESMGFGKISTLSSYFGEGYLIDGKLPKGFLSGNFGMFFQNLFRWNYVA